MWDHKAKIMDLKEITDLIQVRNYVQSATGNYGLSRAVVTDLNAMVILLDKLIVEKLMSPAFKEYIKFEDRAKAIAEVAKLTNIKSGLPQR